ncbi:type III-B CRISPR-associated protein Cas10/Cmr2 [Nostoc sp. RF31YmG]|nr:type III-B CRISPR-associated protein Cas10/Cmr2 [Nostoc sp. RF31YmG]
MNDSRKRIITAIAWCLAWGDKKQLDADELSQLHQMRQALSNQENAPVPAEVNSFVEQAQLLQTLKFPETLAELKDLPTTYPTLWDAKIGLVYGGATKIKQYVFEAAKLPDIRGASALLDRINLVDLPAFFGGEGTKSVSVERWLDDNQFANLRKALIPELIIYSTGGSILAFCPAAFVDKLANAIEKRYTHETLTANSCAVGDTFRLLELRFGLLQNPIEKTLWLEEYLEKQEKPIIKAYFDLPDVTDPEEKFRDRKNFSELVGKLANLFTQRRNGNDLPGAERPSRCYPPMFETHPYIQRDESDRRSLIARVTELPNNPRFSEVLARKRIVGDIGKLGVLKDNSQWFTNLSLGWEPTGIRILSWCTEFEKFLQKPENKLLADSYIAGYQKFLTQQQNGQIIDNNNTLYTRPEEARSLREIGNASNPAGFVAYIYADGNNMGGYIRKQIKTPQQYREFSNDILDATQQSVYKALATHLQAHQLQNLTDPDNENRNGRWIHPFEIITIGGDDVLLIVPADKALAVAKTIGDEFENLLLEKGDRYQLETLVEKPYNPKLVHRYQKQLPESHQCKLSMSTGLLITAEDTPIYYAEKLTSQLLKSAKKRAKELKRDYNYYGGTVDFLVMKAVTMISSNIEEFRQQGLTKAKTGLPKLKLYASPYTLQELGGLLETIKALKKAEFPRSQLYQVRSLLERGKNTAILNYRYFRVRLKQGQDELKTVFEDAWCQPKNPHNTGNLAPWMSLKEQSEDSENQDKMTYETIWRELVDLYPFIAEEKDETPGNQGTGKKDERRVGA